MPMPDGITPREVYVPEELTTRDGDLGASKFAQPSNADRENPGLCIAPTGMDRLACEGADATVILYLVVVFLLVVIFGIGGIRYHIIGQERGDKGRKCLEKGMEVGSV